MASMPDLWEAAKLVSGFEGFSEKPYLDTAGIPTIGYGSTRYPDGTPVALTDAPCTEQDALYYLQQALLSTAKHLWPCLTQIPTAHQWAAMLSLAYNIGIGAITKSTLVRLFNAKDIAGAANQFQVWDKQHHNGVLEEVPGLLARRQKERALFLTP